MLRPCKHCGQEFLVSGKRKKFCSEQCRNAFYIQYQIEYGKQHRTPPKIYTCVICKKEFSWNKGGRPYTCGKNCSQRLNHLNIKKYQQTEKYKDHLRRFKIEHPNYHKEWRQKNSEHLKKQRKKYNETHREEINRRNRERCLRKRKPKACRICGNIFFGKGKSCTLECRKKYYHNYIKSRYIKKEGKLAPCLICSKPFHKKGNKKTCSEECRKKHSRKVNNERLKKTAREYYMKCLLHYTRGQLKCACCGNTNLEFLTLDHIKPCLKGKRRGRGKLHRMLVKTNFPDGFQVLCLACNWLKRRRKEKLCYAHHPELYSTIPKINSFKLKSLNHYGPICKCCGENNIYILSIDHVHGNGKTDKKAPYLYKYIIKNNFPNDYQILCMNCNWLKNNEDKPFCKVHHPELYP